MATIEDMKGFLTSADVVEAVRAGSAIENTLLNEIDLSGLDLQGATFDTVTFNAVHLIDIALRGATLSNVVFNNCMMSGADFTKAKLSGTIFVNADCCQANFTRADLADALFLVDNVPEKDQEKVLFEFDAFELDEDTQNVLRAQGIVGFFPREKCGSAVRISVRQISKGPCSWKQNWMKCSFRNQSLNGLDLRTVRCWQLRLQRVSLITRYLRQPI